MTHSDLDAVVVPWCAKLGLHLYTKCRDDEVRDIHIVDDSGVGYHITVIPLGGENSTVGVDIWSEARTYASYRTTLGSLGSTLDHAYQRVLELITEHGHTRTPVV